LHCGGVDFISGFGSARPSDALVASELGEESERHLGTSSVVGAKEQHRGFGVGDLAFHPGQGGESLAGEAFGQQRQEVGDGGAAGGLVVGGVQEPFDGLYPEGAVELVLQPGGGGSQGQLLVDGEIGVPMVGVLGWGFRSCRASLVGGGVCGKVVVGDDDVVGGAVGVAIVGWQSVPVR
jgi:hypothetical protein